MYNPFAIIEAKLSNIEGLLLDIKHGELNPQPMGDELLTIEQAADFLALTKPTLYAYVSRGEIPHMKRSKRLYFSREDLMNYVKRGRRKTNAEIAAGADEYLTSKRGGTR
jgi:excisionase family DNA binding protein